jgi:hypothetical protein
MVCLLHWQWVFVWSQRQSQARPAAYLGYSIPLLVQKLAAAGLVHEYQLLAVLSLCGDDLEAQWRLHGLGVATCIREVASLRVPVQVPTTPAPFVPGTYYVPLATSWVCVCAVLQRYVCAPCVHTLTLAPAPLAPFHAHTLCVRAGHPGLESVRDTRGPRCSATHNCSGKPQVYAGNSLFRGDAGVKGGQDHD